MIQIHKSKCTRLELSVGIFVSHGLGYLPTLLIFWHSAFVWRSLLWVVRYDYYDAVKESCEANCAIKYECSHTKPSSPWCICKLQDFGWKTIFQDQLCFDGYSLFFNKKRYCSQAKGCLSGTYFMKWNKNVVLHDCDARNVKIGLMSKLSFYIITK